MIDYTKYNKYFRGDDLPLDEIYIDGIEDVKQYCESDEYFEKQWLRYVKEMEKKGIKINE